MGKVKGRFIFDISGFKRGVAGVRKGVASMKSKIGGLFTGMIGKAAAVAAGIVGIAAAIRTMRSATKTIADFDQEMANIRAITRDVSENTFERMASQARKLGATTQFTAGQAAAGMRMLKQGGLSAEEAMRELPATLSLAAAGGLELEEAAAIAVKQFNIFKSQGESVAGVADVLAVAAANSATDVREMSEGMKFASGIAALFDKDIKEVAATLGAMASVGLSGEMGGTALRNLLAELSNENSVAVREIKKYGLAFDEINPRANSLKDVFEKLTTNQGVLNNFTTIFNKRIMQGFGSIIANRDGFLELLGTLENANGEAEKMANIRMDSIKGDFLKLKSIISETFLSLGVEKFFRSVLSGLAQAVRRVAFAVKVIREAIADGRGPELFRKFMILALREAVNFFVKAFFGAVSAFGRYLGESIITAVEVFKIITTADFWKGMGNALLGVATLFAAAMADVTAAALKAVGKIPGLGKLKEKGEAAAAGADELRDQSFEFFQKAGANLEEPIRRAGERFEAMARGIGESFQKGFRRTNGPFDTTADKEEIRAILGGFAQKVRDQQAEVNKTLEAAKGIQKQAAPIAQATAESSPSRVGAIAGAINSIFGRSINADILSVNKDSKKLLEQIAKNTTPTVGSGDPGELVFA